MCSIGQKNEKSVVELESPVRNKKSKEDIHARHSPTELLVFLRELLRLMWSLAESRRKTTERPREAVSKRIVRALRLP